MSQDPLSLLCVEPRFPGRLGAVADWLVRRRGYRCQFYCNSALPPEHWPEAVGKGLELVQFNVGGVAREPAVAWTRILERGLCYAYGCWQTLEARRARGIDMILGRSAGLGSTLFVPVSLPRVPMVNFFDYYYQAHAHDLADEAGPETPKEYFHWRRAANAIDLVELENGVTPWTPTRWQRDLFPADYRQDFVVLHDGINTCRFARQVNGAQLVAGRPIPPEARVVSFVARSLDRLRGFDQFMHLASALVWSRPDVLLIVVGGSRVEHGLDLEYYGRDYKAHVLAQTAPISPDRFWFLGNVPQQVVAEVLAVSELHLYPSRAYAVSRSLLEAMSAGCVVIACDSEPVREFITDGHTGLLVRADDVDCWVQKAEGVLADVAGHRPLGEAAAALIRERYAQDVTLPRLALLFDSLLERS